MLSVIRLTDQANGVLIADAVKFEPENSLPESATWTPTVNASLGVRSFVITFHVTLMALWLDSFDSNLPVLASGRC
jgi:hypothetical protein